MEIIPRDCDGTRDCATVIATPEVNCVVVRRTNLPVLPRHRNLGHGLLASLGDSLHEWLEHTFPLYDGNLNV